MASSPSATAATSMATCVMSRNRRRSTRSPMVPAATANKTIGKLAAVCTNPTYAAEPVMANISHWAPTVCIQLPTLLTNCAPHIAAKSL